MVLKILNGLRIKSDESFAYKLVELNL